MSNDSENSQIMVAAILFVITVTLFTLVIMIGLYMFEDVFGECKGLKGAVEQIWESESCGRENP